MAGENSYADTMNKGNEGCGSDKAFIHRSRAAIRFAGITTIPETAMPAVVSAIEGITTATLQTLYACSKPLIAGKNNLKSLIAGI